MEKKREIRIFISSTFLDMQKERDYLLKNTFLKMKALCAQRSVTFKEIDLRWGITEEESRQGKVLNICLDEINQCRPYFIGLLGERYGWIPDEIPKQVTDQEKWVKKHKKKSVTELEILHGVMNNPAMAGHAFFYFKDPSFLDGIPDGQQHLYDEIPSEGDIARLGHKKALKISQKKKQLLSALKNRIRSSGFNVRENYLTPEELGQLVEKDLTQIINELFPEDESEIGDISLEMMAQESFCREKSELYIGGSRYFDKLNRLVDESFPFININGPSGVGKSSFISRWLMQYKRSRTVPGISPRLRSTTNHERIQRRTEAFHIKNDHLQTIVLFNFAGASRHSTDYRQVLKRFMVRINEYFSLSETIPEDLDNIHLLFEGVLQKIPEEKKLIIVIDGLNQMDGQGISKGIFWLPEKLPRSVSLITCVTPGEIEANLEARGFVPFRILPLGSPKECKRFIDDYLKLYRKKLDRKNKKKIMNSPQAYLPIYLKTLLEEVRMYGDHKTLGDRIDYYLEADNPVGLFKKVLARYEEDYEAAVPGLVGQAMSYIRGARRGLQESELLTLLGRDTGVPLPQFYWTPVFLAARASLLSRNGFLNFSHEYFSQAVEEKYMQTSENRQQAHQILAAFFKTHHDAKRNVEEYPWQLMQLEDWESLSRTLKEPDYFEQVFVSDEYDLYRYWTKIKQHSSIDIPATFRVVFKYPELYRRYLHKVARFFHNLGYLDEAGQLHDLLAAVSIRDGSEENLIPSLIEKANILKHQSEYKKAMQYLDQAETLCRKVKDQDNLQRVLGNQAYFYMAQVDVEKAFEKVDEALEIARQLDSKFVTQHLLAIKSSVFDCAGEFDKALEVSRQAQRICEELNEDASLLSLLLDQATILKKKSDFRQSLSVYRKCIDEAGELGSDQIAAKGLIGQSDVLSVLGKGDEALLALDRAQHIGDRLDNSQIRAESLQKKAQLLHEQGRPEQALASLDTAETLFEKSGFKKDLVACFNTRSLIYNTLEKFDASYQVLEKAEAICRDLNLKDGLQSVIGNQAMILRRYNRLDEALVLYEEKERICRETGNRKSLAICLGNMGNIYYGMKQYDKALELNRQKADIAYEIGNLKSYANALGNQAGILKDMEQWEQSLQLSQKQEEICSDINDVQGLCQSLTNQAIVLYVTDCFSQALEHCDKALRLVSQYGFSPGTRQFLEKIRQDIEKQM